MDTNKDNSVDRAEIKAGLDKLNIHLTDKQVRNASSPSLHLV